MLADKAYSSKAIRATLRARGITTVIPERTDQVASRYDKHAVIYRGGIVLAAIVDWLKHS